MRFLALILGVVCALATAFGVLAVRSGSASRMLHPASAPSLRSQTPAAGSSAQAAGNEPEDKGARPQVGVVVDSLKNFQEATAAYPSLSVRYLSWGSSFPAATILSNRRLGATTLLELKPDGVSLSGIADGSEDAYLKAFAQADRKLGLPILLSFAPEANGSWYQWGAGHITPTLYIDMWRRVHDVILANGGTKITWLWQMNVPWTHSEAMSLLWPGRRYVDEVGIDGQMTTSGATFSSIFGPSLTVLRSITSDPILLSEVSVKAGPERPAEIASLFVGACHEHLEGVVVFDVHEEWQIDHDPASLAVFKRGATAGC